MKTKNLLFAFILLFAIKTVHSQEITFDVMTYNSGYNVTCFGASNGAIDATIVGGTSPYTYSWSNGAHFQDLINIPAGTYTLTVTDHNGSHNSKAVTLNSPKQLVVSLTPSMYEGGYNISQTGANDGDIQAQGNEGTPSYTYLWSNSSTSDNATDLIAGTYSVTLTDQNGCTVTNSATLTEPSPLHIVSITAANHNGHSLSCYKSANGSINLTVTGGAGPYDYNWSNGAFVEDPQNLIEGLYMVEVTDRNGAKTQGQITLTEPDVLAVDLTASNYSGYNISCNNCFNGNIHTTVTGGTSAYSYLWSSGQTSANIYNLGVGQYKVTVTDANGCTVTTDYKVLTEPGSAGWGLHGNTADTTNAIGTTNNAPLNFKTNDTVRMKIKENGDVEVKKSLLFGGGGQLRFMPPPPNSTNEHYLLGPQIPHFFMDPCLPDRISFDFSGVFRSGGFRNYMANNGTSSVPATVLQLMTMGYNGTNGIIEVTGTPENSSALNDDINLLLNTTCGKNIYMCNTDAGQVGIGVNHVFDGFRLSVDGNTKMDNGNLFIHGVDNYSAIGKEAKITLGDENHYIKSLRGTGEIIKTYGNDNNIILLQESTGNVGIGTYLTDNDSWMYKLSVNGNVRAKKVVVELGWMDYVFDKSYVLPTLREVEQYINTNGHLPLIPSAKQIETNGADLGELLKLQMQKIEEATLYIIELNKRIIEQEKRIEALEQNKK